MAAFSPPRISAAWRVEAPFFHCFPCRWVLHSALSLIRWLTVQDAKSCPYNDMSCLFFTALLLQRSQTILVQENQPVTDSDWTCFKTFPVNTTTCLQVGPTSLYWPLDPIARFDQPRPSSFLDVNRIPPDTAIHEQMATEMAT